MGRACKRSCTLCASAAAAAAAAAGGAAAARGGAASAGGGAAATTAAAGGAAAEQEVQQGVQQQQQQRSRSSFFCEREREKIMNNSSPSHKTATSSQTHSAESNGRWRQAATTSDVDGVSPSETRAGRRSRRERANARALAQTSREHQRWCPARDRMRLRLRQLAHEGMSFTRPLTTCLGPKNHKASSAKTSRELRIRRLLPLARLLESGTIFHCRNRGVHSKLGTTEER